jgi:hypothetical protein
MAHVRKEAFIWTRQFTHPQLQRLNRVQSACQWLDSKTIDLSRFARCQLRIRTNATTSITPLMASAITSMITAVPLADEASRNHIYPAL